MPDQSQILEDAEVRSFLETHQGAEERVRNAAEVLSGNPDAIAAVRKLLPALSEKTVTVFFSYKKKDEDAAEKVVGTLRKHAAGRLEITYQAEFTENIVGKAWRDAITEAIRPANWFILLLPDPADDWDWCLFETGLFVAGRSSADRLICLHHPDTVLPKQIEDLQAVSATIPEVTKLLRMVYVKENAVPGMPPINPAIEPDLQEIAKEIVQAIRPPAKMLFREVFEPWVELGIEGAKELESEDGLDRAAVLGANRAALELFGFLHPPASWRELRGDLPDDQGDGRWRMELFHVIRRIAQGRNFYPVQAVFSTKRGRMFRPVACAVDRMGEAGPIERYHVTFSEDVSAVDSTRIPKDIALLADLLRFTFRFRWEVLEKYSQGPLGEDDVVRLDNTLRRIRKDWESRHVGDPSQLFAVFSAEHQERFLAMTASWQEIVNDEGTGKLDVALAAKDPEPIPGLLEAFLPMNQEFLEIAAGRFSELVSGGVPAAA